MNLRTEDLKNQLAQMDTEFASIQKLISRRRAEATATTDNNSSPTTTALSKSFIPRRATSSLNSSLSSALSIQNQSQIPPSSSTIPPLSAAAITAIPPPTRTSAAQLIRSTLQSSVVDNTTASGQPFTSANASSKTNNSSNISNTVPTATTTSTVSEPDTPGFSSETSRKRHSAIEAADDAYEKLMREYNADLDRLAKLTPSLDAGNAKNSSAPSSLNTSLNSSYNRSHNSSLLNRSLLHQNIDNASRLPEQQKPSSQQQQQQQQHLQQVRFPHSSMAQPFPFSSTSSFSSSVLTGDAMPSHAHDLALVDWENQTDRLFNELVSQAGEKHRFTLEQQLQRAKQKRYQEHHARVKDELTKMDRVFQHGKRGLLFSLYFLFSLC